MNIPLLLKQARLSHNLTLEALGSKVNRSKQYMYALEKGNIKLSYDMAVKIALALGTTPDEVFLEKPDYDAKGVNSVAAHR